MVNYSEASFTARLAVRSLLVCCFLALACSACGADDPFWKERFKDELQKIIDKYPREKKGLDCSGYIYLAGRRAGIPGIRRTTAKNMALGRDGWFGEDVEWYQSEPRDLIFWTFKPDRIHGHVGVIWDDKDGLHYVTHASMSRNRIVVDKIKGSLWDDISKIRRLGDPQ